MYHQRRRVLRRFSNRCPMLIQLLGLEELSQIGFRALYHDQDLQVSDKRAWLWGISQLRVRRHPDSPQVSRFGRRQTHQARGPRCSLLSLIYPCLDRSAHRERSPFEH